MEIRALQILMFQKALIPWRIGSVIQPSKVSDSGHAWNQNYQKINLVKPKLFMKVLLHRIRFRIFKPLSLFFNGYNESFLKLQSSCFQMKASHALIRLRKFILVYSLPFLLWQFFHYSVWVISEPNYEKSSTPGKDFLSSNYDFLSESILFQEFLLLNLQCKT